MTVEAGELVSTSVSEIELFDECENLFVLERVGGQKPEQKRSQNEGEMGHLGFATYFKTGKLPGRQLMAKAVKAAILKGELPRLGPDLEVERRLSGQPQYDDQGNWVPLDKSQTLHLAGVPIDGMIDLSWRRTAIPVVLDHKFSSDPAKYAKAGEDLIKTVQMPVYAASQRRRGWQAAEWRMVHHYVAKTGTTSFMRQAVVTSTAIDDRIDRVVRSIERMKTLAGTTEQVTGNLNACERYGGCPHKLVCHTYRKGAVSHAMPNNLELTKAEEEMFNSIPEPPAAPPPPAETKRRLLIVDVSKCGACDEPLTPENSSRLQSGVMFHVGCPKAQPIQNAPAVLPPDAPASKPELASEQPKPEKPKKEKKPKPPAAAEGATLQAATITYDPRQTVMDLEAAVGIAAQINAPVDPHSEAAKVLKGATFKAAPVTPDSPERIEALAQLFDAVSRVLRSR